MCPDWTHTLAEREAGRVPGYRGNDESFEDFAERTERERTEPAEAEEFHLPDLAGLDADPTGDDERAPFGGFNPGGFDPTGEPSS